MCSSKHQINESGDWQTDRQSGPQSASQPVIQTNCQEQQHFLVFSCSAVPEAITLVSNGSDTILLLSLDFDQLGRISAINSPGGEFWCVLWTTVSQTINKLKPSGERSQLRVCHNSSERSDADTAPVKLKWLQLNPGASVESCWGVHTLGGVHSMNHNHAFKSLTGPQHCLSVCLCVRRENDSFKVLHISLWAKQFDYHQNKSNIKLSVTRNILFFTHIEQHLWAVSTSQSPRGPRMTM